MSTPPPRAPCVYTIAAGVPFLDALADGIVAEAGDDALALSRVTVLLPTRRACRALRDAFLRRSAGAPTLLPRLRPIGDVDEDELSLTGELSLAGEAGDLGYRRAADGTLPRHRRAARRDRAAAARCCGAPGSRPGSRRRQLGGSRRDASAIRAAPASRAAGDRPRGGEGVAAWCCVRGGHGAPRGVGGGAAGGRDHGPVARSSPSHRRVGGPSFAQPIRPSAARGAG